MDQQARKTWSYGESDGDLRYELRLGGRVVGRVGSKGDAEMICRARQETLREMSRTAFEARQHRAQILRLQDDVRELMATLRKVADCLRLLKPREITTAREVATRTLRAMKARGHVE